MAGNYIKSALVILWCSGMAFSGISLNLILCLGIMGIIHLPIKISQKRSGTKRRKSPIKCLQQQGMKAKPLLPA